RNCIGREGEQREPLAPAFVQHQRRFASQEGTEPPPKQTAVVKARNLYGERHALVKPLRYGWEISRGDLERVGLLQVMDMIRDQRLRDLFMPALRCVLPPPPTRKTDHNQDQGESEPHSHYS